MLWEILGAIPFIILFALLLRYVKLPGYDPLLNGLGSTLFIVKSTISIAFFGLSFYYLPLQNLLLDSNHFFADSKILHDVFFQSPLDFFKLFSGLDKDGVLSSRYLQNTSLWDSPSVFNNNRTMIRLNCLIHFFSFHNMYIHIVCFNWLSIIGLKQIAKFFMKFSSNYRLFFITICILLPTLVYSSGQLMKEGLVLTGIGFILTGFGREEISWRSKAIYWLIGIGILLYIKPYILFLVLYTLLFFFVSRRSGDKLKNWSFGVLFLMVTAGLLFAVPSVRNEIISYVSYKQDDMVQLSKGGIFIRTIPGGNAGMVVPPDQRDKIEISGGAVRIKDTVNGYFKDERTDYLFEPGILLPDGKIYDVYIDIPPANTKFEAELIHKDPAKFFKSIPQALLNGMFRPFIFDSGGVMKWLAVGEYLLCYCFVIVAFIMRRQIDKESGRMIMTLCLFAFSLYLVAGFAVQVSGAIVRYRVFALLALYCAGFIALKEIRWKKNEM